MIRNLRCTVTTDSVLANSKTQNAFLFTVKLTAILPYFVCLFQQSLLDRVPSGESQAERLQEQQSKLLHFCDDALATSIRMEHAAITQRISNLQAGLETWKDFLKRVLLLTATFEDQVNNIESVCREIHTAVTEPDVLPLSHTGMQNRLENLRVSPAANINTPVLEWCWHPLI